MTATKTIFTGISFATLVLGGGIVYLLMNLNHIAKPITERIATETLGVPVTIQSLDINLQDRIVKVGGLKIANPPGYNTPYALKTTDIEVELESISKELITFKNIKIDESNVNLEVNPQGTNLNDIKKGISAKRPKPAQPDPQPAEAREQAPMGDKMKVVIKNFAFTRASLNPTVTLIKEQALDQVVVPDVILKGIGERENGILAREAIAQIANEVFKNLNSAARQSGFLGGLSEDTLKEMGQGQIDALKDNISGGIKDVGDKVRSLFGN